VVARRILLGASLVLCLSWVVFAQKAVRTFTPVQGGNFQEKLDVALKTARSRSPQGQFWSAYGFDVRPGVAMDVQIISDDGSVFNLDGTSISVGDTQIETRNLGVFILRDMQTGTISRVDIYNLERDHEYSGYPVYWLGRVSNDESLNFLKALALVNEQGGIGEPAVLAIAVHDDQKVPSNLIELARSAKSGNVRLRAVGWLGRTPTAPETMPFLSSLARSSSTETELREQAIRALGRRKDPASLAVLTGIYQQDSDQRIKRRVVSAVAMNDDRKGAVKFLLGVAGNDADPEAKRGAMAQLSRLAIRRDGQPMDRLDPETQVQREAVVAIARRPKEESVPLLINIARTHPKEEVRRQAMLLLGRISDDRVLVFFTQELTK
jgi:hypothetical protein